MSVTPRRVDNNLRDSYAVGVITIDVGGVQTDIQTFVLVDSTGAAISTTNPLPMATTPTPVSSVVTETTASVGTSSGTVLAANSTRKGGWVKAAEANTADVFVSFSATATTAKPSRLSPGMVLPFTNYGILYTGVVAAISASGTQSLEVVQL